jgi:DNA (cytosine-5)-methyltransferase 1
MKPFIYNLSDVIRESNRNLFTFISTFAGGGGSSTGYRLAGGRPLAVNEFIPEAQRVYNINYPDTKIYPEDIRNLTVERLLNELELEPGELDIFDGSPPCSSFSSVGLKEKGWGKVKKYSDSEQRTDDLFFEYARLLKGLQPKAFIAENVKGITMGKANDLLGNGQMTVFGDEEETTTCS